MGSITQKNKERCEFEPDERPFDSARHIRTTDHTYVSMAMDAVSLGQAGRRTDSTLYRLDRNYCLKCGKHRKAAAHRAPETIEVEVPDNVEEMYENAQKADSRDFDVAQETEKRGWTALAVLSHISDPDRQVRACMTEDAVMEAEVNWRTAVEWFTAVEGGQWDKYTSPHTWFGSSTSILFDPTHPGTAEVAERIDDMLGPDSGNVVLDEDALNQAKIEQLDEYLTSGHLRGAVPMTVDTAEVGRLLRQLDGDDYWDTKAVQEIPHQFDEGFNEVEGTEDEYLCVCGLREINEIHHVVPGQQMITKPMTEEDHG